MLPPLKFMVSGPDKEARAGIAKDAAACGVPIVDNWDPSVTHIISKDNPPSSVKLFHALLGGCHVVTAGWLAALAKHMKALKAVACAPYPAVASYPAGEQLVAKRQLISAPLPSESAFMPTYDEGSQAAVLSQQPHRRAWFGGLTIAHYGGSASLIVPMLRAHGIDAVSLLHEEATTDKKGRPIEGLVPSTDPADPAASCRLSGEAEAVQAKRIAPSSADDNGGAAWTPLPPPAPVVVKPPVSNAFRSAELILPPPLPEGHPPGFILRSPFDVKPSSERLKAAYRQLRRLGFLETSEDQLTALLLGQRTVVDVITAAQEAAASKQLLQSGAGGASQFSQRSGSTVSQAPSATDAPAAQPSPRQEPVAAAAGSSSSSSSSAVPPPAGRIAAPSSSTS